MDSGQLVYTKEETPAEPPQEYNEENKRTYYIIFSILLVISGLAGAFLNIKGRSDIVNKNIKVGSSVLSDWNRISTLGTHQCSEIAVKDNAIIVSCEEHLFRSSDNGATWMIDSYWEDKNKQNKTSNKIKDFPTHIVFGSTDKTIFAASEWSGIYKSLDGGQSWTAINTGVHTPYAKQDGVGVTGIALASNDSTLYAIAGDYTLIKSDNKGDSWQIIQDNLSLNGLYINPSDSNQIYLNFNPTIKSSDGGKTIVTGEDKLPKLSSINSYYIDPNNFQKIMVSGFGGLFESTDGGNSWNSIDSALNNLKESTDTEQKWISTFAVNPKYPNTIAVGTKGHGVFITNDNGVTWTGIEKGITPERPTQIVSAEKIVWSSDGTKLFLITNYGLYILE